MNLYRIIVLHGAPKDSHESTECYLLAKNDIEVAEWINDNKCYGKWKESDEPNYFSKEDKDISMWDYILENKGDLGDENGWEDAYYGVTKWGWEDLGAISDKEIKVYKKFIELKEIQNET